MIFYLRVVSFILVLISFFLVVPPLISYPDTYATLLGIILAIIYPPVLYLQGKGIAKMYLNKLNSKQKGE